MRALPGVGGGGLAGDAASVHVISCGAARIMHTHGVHACMPRSALCSGTSTVRLHGSVWTSTAESFRVLGLVVRAPGLALPCPAAAMHEQGFEYALTHGYPRNPNPWRYKYTPPCCKVIHTDTYR